MGFRPRAHAPPGKFLADARFLIANSRSGFCEVPGKRD
jgi:hypothetical protein